MSRASKRWLAGVGVFAALAATAIYFFEWNMLRGPIARQVERATGRTFAINGDLHVHLAMKPRITAEGLVLGNAEWARDARMAEIGRLDFIVDLRALFHRRAIFDEINLTDANLSLERGKNGEANWEFGKKERNERPVIHALTIDHGRIAFRDPTIKTDVLTTVSTVPAGEADAGMLRLSSKGQVKG